MKTSRAIPEKEALERFPVHFQQALQLASAILRRISEKRLDNDADESLISVVQKTNGGSDEN